MWEIPTLHGKFQCTGAEEPDNPSNQRFCIILRPTSQQTSMLNEFDLI
jgi:hypothetical protein